MGQAAGLSNGVKKFMDLRSLTKLANWVCLIAGNM